VVFFSTFFSAKNTFLKELFNARFSNRNKCFLFEKRQQMSFEKQAWKSRTNTKNVVFGKER
jgi:hypothetical protein